MLHVNTLANLPAGIETLCVCVPVYVSTYIHGYRYTYICGYMYVYTVDTYIYIYIYIYVCMYHYVTMGLSGFGRQKRPRNCQEIW